MFRPNSSNGSNTSLATLSLRSQGSTSDIGRSSSTSLKRDTSRDGHDDPVDIRASIEYDVAPENERLLPTNTDGTGVAGGEIDKWALACLLLQHVSNTFNTGLYEFASFLFLIEVYRDTLVPASLVGLFAKLTGLLLSGHIGGLVDSAPRLPFVRWALGVEKVLNACNYALFLILFGPLRDVAQAAFHGQASAGAVAATWTIIALTVGFSSITNLANSGMVVAVERDWVTTIAQGNPDHLTMLNTYIRRIDLMSKLGAPLFVSLLTTLFGYTTATLTLLALAIGSFALEYWWIEVVFKRFPMLQNEEPSRRDNEIQSPTPPGTTPPQRQFSIGNAVSWLRRERDDWLEFARLPVFASSLAIASIYLTTLSYDGAFIAYIKAARGWDDGFIAAMRGLCVVTGMVGTVVMPILENRVGLVRAGSWSIWFEVGCLAPVLISFFYGTGQYGEHGPAWNTVLLFGGVAMSRIGLWSFDLVQLKELQLELDDHPRRNRLTALQISLQNLFDLAKYALTLSASSPRQFKWTALVSFIAVVAGGASYTVYLKKMRGHVLHPILQWWSKSK